MKNILKIIGFTAGVLFILWVLSWFFDGTKWLEKGYIADRDVRIAGPWNCIAITVIRLTI